MICEGDVFNLVEVIFIGICLVCFCDLLIWDLLCGLVMMIGEFLEGFGVLIRLIGDFLMVFGVLLLVRSVVFIFCEIL